MPPISTSSSSLLATPADFTTLQEELNFYKGQYEHLASELRDFQETSRELEAELERDADAAEKREKKYKAQIETLGYEVEEWKTKHKNSKTEALAAQAILQKEITTLRDAQRTAQLQLRDMEVANDDYERQARNTTSSLEDMSTKYDTVLERNAMLEEVIRIFKQERQELQIEAQRLRDELSDTGVEVDILKNKLQAAEAKPTKLAIRPSTAIDSSFAPAPNAGSHLHVAAAAATTTEPAPIACTPNVEGIQDSPAGSVTNSPPSPPMSEVSASAQTATSQSSAINSDTVVRPTKYLFADGTVDIKAPLAGGNTAMPRFARPTRVRTASSSTGPRQSLARSGSLYQIRGLVGRMQQLEERVQQVKSKLPTQTGEQVPSKHSPTTKSDTVPAKITMRRTSRRPSELMPGQRLASSAGSSQPRRLSHRPSRLDERASPEIELSNLTTSRGDHPRTESSSKSPLKALNARQPGSRLSHNISPLPEESSVNQSFVTKERYQEHVSRHVPQSTGPFSQIQASARSDRRISNNFGPSAGRISSNMPADPP